MTAIERSYPRSTGRLLLLAGAMFVVGTNAFVIAGLLPQMAADLRVPRDQVSLAITWYSLVVALVSPLVAIALPRVPRGVLMAGGLAVFTVGAGIAASAHSLLAFDLGRILSGFGGAALVPTATAAAAALVPQERRGRALALVGAGFTLATAIGAPFGTALGGVAGWRTPLVIIVAVAVALTGALALAVRGVPLPPVVPLARRLAPLRSPRILSPLGATLLMIAGFNVVYIFSSTVAAAATGGDPTLLAALLLCYGIAGVVGNAIAGPLTDRLGSRTLGALSLGGHAVVLVAFPFAEGSFPAMAALYALWGVVAFAAAVPVQHRLVAVDPESSALALSWYSTAMYLGIAVAPLAGSAAARLGGAVAVPLVGALALALATVLFLAGWLGSRRARRAEVAAV